MNFRLKYFFLLVVFCCVQQVYPELITQGFVYNDRNGNGVFDKGEYGIAGVAVSNGIDIVRTDSKGGYVLNCKLPVSVFPILPSGYRFADKSGKIPNSNFRYIVTGESLKEENLNFGLQKTLVKRVFTLAAIGDIQVNDSIELGFAEKSVIKELAADVETDVAITMGDIVNDHPDLFPAVKQLINSCNCPVWTVYGNHDREMNDSSTSDAGYCRFFGASVYAFNMHDTHFLVLNNMLPKGRYGYEVRLSDEELKFVANDLSMLSQDTRIVIAMHGPLRFTRNKDELLALLKGRPNVLVLSGHTHIVERYFHRNGATVIPELGVGASCGTWWTGEKDKYGVPYALMQCGTPRGYYRLNFSEKAYSFTYKVIGDSSGRQMDVWVNPSLVTSEHQGSDSTCILVNVFGGSDSTVVKLELEDGREFSMQKVDVVSPNVAALLSTTSDRLGKRNDKSRIPLRRKNSPHCWQLILPKVVSGEHAITIKAFDSFGFSISEKRKISIN